MKNIECLRAIPEKLATFFTLQSADPCFEASKVAFFSIWGNLNEDLANRGLARKAPIGPKRALSGEFLLFPCGCEARKKLVSIGPKNAQIGPAKAPISRGKARFSRAADPPRFSLRIWGLSPRLRALIYHWGQNYQIKRLDCFEFMSPTTPRHKTNTFRKKFLGNNHFSANTCGACIRTARIQENIFEESFSAY